MKNRILFLMSIVIMIIALLFMGINWLTAAIPEWIVRVTGIIIMVDLVVLAYSSTRLSVRTLCETKEKGRSLR